MKFSLLAIATTAGVATASSHLASRGELPKLPYDPKTTSYCTYWWDNNDGSLTCEDIPETWDITLSDFVRWNPSVTPQCGNYLKGKSYCIEATNEPVTGPPTTTTTTTTSKTSTTTTKPTTTTTLKTSTTTTAKPSTTTPVGNGIATPSPLQPGVVGNCDAFYMVAKGDTCDAVASKNGITAAQVVAWNTGVGASCSGLWADTYACVSIVGHTPGPTTTKPANGVATPSPVQAGMVTNCKKFHFVKKGEFCAGIATAEGVTVANIVKWNPAVGNDCTSMWAETYLCVGVL